MQVMNKEYIGDGVFIECDGDYIVLTTSDGVRNTNTIYLEIPQAERIADYVQRMKGR